MKIKKSVRVLVSIVLASLSFGLIAPTALAKNGAPDKVESFWMEGVVTDASLASMQFTGNVLYINNLRNPNASQVVTVRCALNQLVAASTIQAYPVGTAVEVNCQSPKGTYMVNKIVPGHTFF